MEQNISNLRTEAAAEALQKYCAKAVTQSYYVMASEALSAADAVGLVSEISLRSVPVYPTDEVWQAFFSTHPNQPDRGYDYREWYGDFGNFAASWSKAVLSLTKETYNQVAEDIGIRQDIVMAEKQELIEALRLMVKRLQPYDKVLFYGDESDALQRAREVLAKHGENQ